MASPCRRNKANLILLAFFIIVLPLIWTIGKLPVALPSSSYLHADKGDSAARSTSWCSDEATQLGPGQKVVSYSLFNITLKNSTLQNSKRALYQNNLHCIIASMRTRYPGWIMRIYTNYEWRELNALIVHKDVYVCDVRRLPFFGDITAVHPAVWRFIVLGDPTVRMFMVRDSDNDLGMREKSAVDDWIRSGKPFHAMRDHPLHVTDVLAGEWGGNNELIGYQRGHNLTLEILRKARSGVGPNGLHLYGADQPALKFRPWFQMENDIPQEPNGKYVIFNMEFPNGHLPMRPHCFHELKLFHGNDG